MTWKIKIAPSIHSQGSKELVAKAIENYFMMCISTGEKYITGNTDEDVNAYKLADYLNKCFPEIGPWIVNSNRKAFDIYSFKAKIAIELKSANSASANINTNASIYPLDISVKEVVVGKDRDPSWTKIDLDLMMDVLVVVVGRDNDIIKNYRVVDGSYWGVKFEDYLSCGVFFTQMNSLKDKILAMIVDEYGELASFANGLLTKKYKGVGLDFRKLVRCKNPLNEGNVEDQTCWWDDQKEN